MPPAGFEPAIPAGERLQTHALDRSATGIGSGPTFRGLNHKKCEANLSPLSGSKARNERNTSPLPLYGVTTFTGTSFSAQ